MDPPPNDYEIIFSTTPTTRNGQPTAKCRDYLFFLLFSPHFTNSGKFVLADSFSVTGLKLPSQTR